MSLPTKCRIPYCTACETQIWATGVAQREDRSSGIRAGQVYPLWPRPDSVYARLATSTGEAPGVAFCPVCAPAIGELALDGYGPVLRYDTAKDRYEAWYTPKHGEFLRLWLRDGLQYNDLEIEAIMAQWTKDSRG